MTTQTIPALLTAEEFMQRDDLDGPVELVKGKVIEMPPPSMYHGVVCSNLAFLIKLHLQQHDLGYVFTNDGSVVTERDPDTVRGADLGFISYAKIPKGQFPKSPVLLPPDLVVEVRSPSDRWRDITKKVLEYLDAGVTVVCVLDPTTETGRIYRSDRDEEQLKNSDLVRFDDVLPGFSVPLKQLFE
jgi:Uma2 family endonuclease